MSFICHIHNYTEYNEEWNLFSAFNPSKLEQWASDCAAPGKQFWGFGALLKGLTSVVDTSCRSRDLNPQPWVTSGFKSNALSIRPRLNYKPPGHPTPVYDKFIWCFCCESSECICLFSLNQCSPAPPSLKLWDRTKLMELWECPSVCVVLWQTESISYSGGLVLPQ